MIAAAALAAVAAGCPAAPTVYRCASSVECTFRGTTGTCEDTSFCSFPDASCPGSGRRYGEFAGAGLARACVEPADGGLDGGRDVPDGGASACGKLTLFADDFEDGARSARVWDASWETPVAATRSLSGGAAAIALVTDSPGTAGFGSGNSYDFTESEVSVEITQMVNPTTEAWLYLHVGQDDDNFLELKQGGGTLFLTVEVAGAATTVGTVPYDASAQRWWRLRESAGTTYWEVSPDGTSWSEVGWHATPALARLASVVLCAGTYQNETNPGTARFDNVNHGTPRGNACPAAGLRDDFDDERRGDEWRRAYSLGGATQTEVGGRVTFTPAGNQPSQSQYVSSTVYDLTGSSVTVEVPQSLAAQNGWTFLRLLSADGGAVEVTRAGGTLACRYDLGGPSTTVGDTPFDPAAHRWWRLSEAAGTTRWETAPDGVTWTPRCSAASPVPVTEVLLAIGAGTDGALASPGTAAFDNFNLPPAH